MAVLFTMVFFCFLVFHSFHFSCSSSNSSLLFFLVILDNFGLRKKKNYGSLNELLNLMYRFLTELMRRKKREKITGGVISSTHAGTIFLIFSVWLIYFSHSLYIVWIIYRVKVMTYFCVKWNERICDNQTNELWTFME